MARLGVTLLLLIATLQLPALAASSVEKRVALVIGNSTYKHAGDLANPKNDADDVSRSLEKLGFTVIKGLDLDKRGMEATLHKFASALDGSKVGVFFYAGHGLQVSGRNYMVPIDAKLSNSYSVDFELIRLDLVHRTMERASKTNILFLDACRDNPLARNLARAMGTRSSAIGRGLATMEAGVGTLISFSTQPGNVALDGFGRNSPYAKALVKQFARSRSNISDMLIRVRRDVMSDTQRKQVPWEHSALTDQFYFSKPSQSNAAGQPKPNFEKQAEIEFWKFVKSSNEPAMLNAYLKRYPTGAFVPLAQALIEKLEKIARKTAEANRKELELREAELKKRRAQEAEKLAKQQEQQANQSATLKKARDEAARAKQALAKAEKEREAALKAAQAARQQKEQAMAEAEQFEPKKLASLTPPSPKKPEPADQNSYIQPVQLLLQKKGCYTGRIDGHWGPKSQEALIKALGNTASDAPIDEALVNRLSASKLTCPAQTVETDRFMSNVTVNKAAATKRKCLTFKECRTKCTSEGNNRCAVFCSGRGALGYRYGLCDQ